MDYDERHRLDELEAEVAQLRRELVGLREGLAMEVRTRRVLVGDGDETGPEVSISVSEQDPYNPEWGWASLRMRLGGGASAECIDMTVSSESIPPYATVSVNGIALPVPQPA